MRNAFVNNVIKWTSTRGKLYHEYIMFYVCKNSLCWRHFCIDSFVGFLSCTLLFSSAHTHTLTICEFVFGNFIQCKPVWNLNTWKKSSLMDQTFWNLRRHTIFTLFALVSGRILFRRNKNINIHVSWSASSKHTFITHSN